MNSLKDEAMSPYHSLAVPVIDAAHYVYVAFCDHSNSHKTERCRAQLGKRYGFDTASTLVRHSFDRL